MFAVGGEAPCCWRFHRFFCDDGRRQRVIQRLPGAEVACLRFVIGALTVGLFSLFGLRLRSAQLIGAALRGLLGSGAVLLYFVAIAHLPSALRRF